MLQTILSYFNIYSALLALHIAQIAMLGVLLGARRRRRAPARYILPAPTEEASPGMVPLQQTYPQGMLAPPQNAREWRMWRWQQEAMRRG